VWGFGFRRNWDHLSGGRVSTFTPDRSEVNIANVFVQDEINLVQDELWLTVGSKLEHNGYTGFDAEPSVRLLWTPSRRATLWLAYANATRTPARNERGVQFPIAAYPDQNGVVDLVCVVGNPQFQNEKLNAYEFGYRSQVSKRVSLDVATFYNSYRGLETVVMGVPFFQTTPPPPHEVVPAVLANKMFGHTYGAEASVDWQVTSAWLLTGGYTWFNPSIGVEPPALSSANMAAAETETPRNQLQAHARYNLPHNFEFDAALYRIGRSAQVPVRPYDRVDTRVGWNLSEGVNLSIVGQDLLTPQHLEFEGQQQTFASTRVKRRVYGILTWRF
jgi:iron complex outermembrane receptor protein